MPPRFSLSPVGKRGGRAEAGGVEIEHTRKRIAWLLKSPPAMLVGGFAGVILLGAVILGLPWCHATGRISFLDALFTSTSAVCVTGLTVLDTANDFTFLGQAVILLLIQTGGLGVMSFAALAFQIVGRRMSLQSQALLSDSFFQRDAASDLHRSFRTILVITLTVETIGAVLLFLLLAPAADQGSVLFTAVFHSVSAFCNAGFSTYRDNLMETKGNTGVLFVIMTLIVLGGLGYVVLHELWLACIGQVRKERFPSPNRFTLHARIVFRVSAALVFGGAVFLLVFGLTPHEVSWLDRLVHALFQSVTARTAGFNSVDIGQLPAASLFILIMLMFVGGSPASCAGGVKTTALAIWLGGLRASLYGERDVRLLHRALPPYLVNRAEFLIALAVFWNILGVLLLLATQTHLTVKPLDLMFEQVSAFGTVGLSTGLTPNLSPFGKLWIIATMFVGRVGPLTVAIWIFPRSDVRVKYPKGTVMIG